MWKNLPTQLYTADQVKTLDALAIEQLSITGYELMERAAAAAWKRCRQQWPSASGIHVFCGAGNNAGDGYVLARLAKADGKKVRVTVLVDIEQLSGEARRAADDWLACGGQMHAFDGSRLPTDDDVVIDALIGTGLTRDVEGDWRQVISWINQRHGEAVLSLDIPSGLCGNSGAVRGVAVRATSTVCFVGLKLGLCTGSAADFRGGLIFEDLGIGELQGAPKPAARRLLIDDYCHLLAPRKPSNHKGMHGHLMLLGGFQGMSGAILLSGEAALRSGTGLVSVATWPGHSNQLNLGRPELMVRGVLDSEELIEVSGRATVAAIGPGLGREAWSRQLFEAAVLLDMPKVLDADALFHLAEHPSKDDRRVLTPHPGEAAKLLGCTSLEVQKDRVHAVKNIQQMYGGVVLLKGSGTMIATPQGDLYVCTDGNPGMAVGGMGDILTGLIASLIAQGISLREATCLGVLLHARSADEVAGHHGTRGLLPSDLFPVLRRMVNEHEPAN